MLHDETTYERPESFAPERYLTESGDLDPDAPDLAPVFGYGRRACGGPHMAQDSVWIAAASMLWAFGMEKALDSNGVPIEVTGDYNFGLVRYAFPARLRTILEHLTIFTVIRSRSNVHCEPARIAFKPSS